jgi:hypothetical protein
MSDINTAALSAGISAIEHNIADIKGIVAASNGTLDAAGAEIVREKLETISRWQYDISELLGDAPVCPVCNNDGSMCGHCQDRSGDRRYA